MPAGPADMNGALREWAELYLRDQLGVMPGWPKYHSRLPPDELGRRGFERDERAHVLGQFRVGVEVLATIGVLGEEESSRWLARFESALAGEEPCLPEPGRDPASEERARRLLGERLRAVSAGASGADGRAALSRFEEALTAVRVAGALSREEIARWSTRSGEAAGTQGQEWLRRRHKPPWAWKGTELERVGVGSPERQAGMAITHAELHADGLVIHCHRVAAIELPHGRQPSPAERHRAVRAAYPPPGDWPNLEVTDDLGTTYHLVPLGAPYSEYAKSDDVVVAWATQRFLPAVPAKASELRVSYQSAIFTLALAA